ncbi:MAG: vWA domain-containing protein [Verrucomicrobiota bacterium]
MKAWKILFAAIISITGTAFAADIDQELNQEQATQTATSITIIFDTSGSMAENNKIGQAKNAFSKWLASLPEEYNLCLIDFVKGQARLAVPLGDGNRDQALAHVGKVRPYGKTPVCECLKIAQTQIDQRRAEHSPYERHVVVVFTDGKETVDRRGDAGVADEIRKLRSSTIEVVGIGFHGEGDYMKPIATTYYHAGDEKELVAGLSKVDAEIGDDSDVEITPSDLKLIAGTDIPTPAAPSPDKK